MNFGASFTGVTFFQAPPTVPGADNGLSLDANTGNFVLGNDIGDPLSPAQLLSSREIITNSAFRIFLKDFVAASVQLFLSEQRIQIEEQTNLGFVEMHVNGGTSQITANSQTPGGDAVSGLSNLTSSVVWQTNGVQPFWELQNPTETFDGKLILGVLNILSSGGKGLKLDSVANDLASTGTLSSADPGSGSGKWKLGKRVAAAVALDATQYIELDVDGTVFKIGIVT